MQPGDVRTVEEMATINGSSTVKAWLLEGLDDDAVSSGRFDRAECERQLLCMPHDLAAVWMTREIKPSRLVIPWPTLFTK